MARQIVMNELPNDAPVASKQNTGVTTTNTTSANANTTTATTNTKTTGTAGGTTTTTQAPKFEYEAYQDPEVVKQAFAQIEQYMANQPGKWEGGTYSDMLKDIYNQIMNREKFSYDLNGDALYQQYKDKYIQQGKMAMMDTMGQAQAMTGGYGNSYAQSVGQQAYQSSLQNLNDIVPELYQLALNQYNQEGQELYDQAALLGQQEDREYGIHRDEVSDYWTNLNYLTEDAKYKAQDAYSKWADKTSMDYDNFWNTTNFNYQTEQDALAESWRKKEFDLALEEFAWEKEQAALAAAGGGGGDGNTGGNTGDGGNTFQKAIFSRVDENGNYVFYIDGKERTYAPGVNPYTGTKNSDCKNGTFSNGYQPDNINGQKLSKSGITDVVNGVTQNVWKTPDGKLWIWDGTQNKYLEYDDGSKKNPAATTTRGPGSGGVSGRNQTHTLN